MSYILYALTKSQQERRQGGVPTLSTPQLTVDPAKGAHTRYASGALILVTGAAIVFAAQTLIRQHDGFNLPPQTAADAPTGTAPTAPVVAPSSELAPSPITPATEAPPAPSLPATPPAAQTPSASPPVPATRQAAQASGAPPPTPSQPLRLTRRDDIALTNAPIASPPRPAAPADKSLESTASSAPAATPQAAVTAPPPMSSEETTLKSIEERLFPGASEAMHPETARLADELLEMAARPVPRPEPSAVVPDEPALSEVIPLPASPQAAPTAPSSPHRETATAAAPSPSAARAEVSPTAARAPAGGDVLPGVRALPSDLQASLGRLTINAHVYHDEPSGRMVIINMNRYREGESLREGPRVEAITITGAVLSYQSHRFHLNVR
jgi:hypothetical protein